MTSNLTQLNRPSFSKESIDQIAFEIKRILASGNMMLGEWSEKFETGFRSAVGVNHAITTNTCTTAIQIVLQYLDVRGREVMVPSGSFISDVSVIRWAGGIPILVDMNPSTLSFDLSDLARKLSHKTKAILWIHLTGIISAEYGQIVDFAKQHDLFLIEDCAHAHGASVDGKLAGSLGDAGCFSFFPGKLLTTGSGGMITTGNQELANYAREVRVFGRSISGGGDVVREGNDWFMDEVRACIGWHQLGELDTKLERRREIAAKYNNAFQNIRALTIFSVPSGNLPSYYQYALLLDSSLNRDKFIGSLKDRFGISAKRIYLPTHKEAIFSNLEFDAGGLKMTEETLDSSVCLPGHHAMSDEDVGKVINAVKMAIQEAF